MSSSSALVEDPSENNSTVSPLDFKASWESVNVTEFLHELASNGRSVTSSVLMTIIYLLIFVTGIIGNTCTCVVIARNKYMHTATNFYLFSLAVSDLLLLILGLPQEIYQIWIPVPYIFGETFCIIRGLAAETSTNASILTITSFTVERYLAICHPLRSHTMSRLSRAVRLILLIWVVAALCAIPMAIQFGIVYHVYAGYVILDSAECVVKKPLPHAFELSTFSFFCLPVTVITVLYVLIGLRLRRSSLSQKDSSLNSDGACDYVGHCGGGSPRSSRQQNGYNSRRAVIKMLVAVVVAFFVCWAPFHAQRLMAIYASSDPLPIIVSVYEALMYVSGVLYYVSATINPILYHIMSLKFRMAFKDTLALCVGRRPLRSGKFNSLSHFTSTLRSRPPPETTESTVMEGLCREEDPENPSAEQQPRCTNGAVKSSLIGVASRGNSSKSRKRIIPVMDPSTSNRIVKTDSISNSSMQMVEDEAMNPVDLSNFMAQLNDNKYNGHTEMTNGNNHHAATPS